VDEEEALRLVGGLCLLWPLIRSHSSGVVGVQLAVEDAGDRGPNPGGRRRAVDYRFYPFLKISMFFISTM
jgi:hypothetical protein